MRACTVVTTLLSSLAVLLSLWSVGWVQSRDVSDLAPVLIAAAMWFVGLSLSCLACIAVFSPPDESR